MKSRKVAKPAPEKPVKITAMQQRLIDANQDIALLTGRITTLQTEQAEETRRWLADAEQAVQQKHFARKRIYELQDENVRLGLRLDACLASMVGLQQLVRRQYQGIKDRERGLVGSDFLTATEAVGIAPADTAQMAQKRSININPRALNMAFEHTPNGWEPREL